MKKYAEDHDIDANIEAVAEVKFSEVIDNFDIALLAPQMRFSKNRLEEITKPKGILLELINTTDYGTMNGENVLKLTIDALSRNKT
ncbi:PTS system, diacetylchitobiose-specific IIB component (plasmid) [Borrelia coriaceae ATCC 43381]|uniref:PTS system, diacetylchitobiose-specific IIB component n=2 Tax=Borrelia coriaceae TaxID=144 RepID=W5SYK7_9SPIR|nr:cytochrome C biogenesis protein CcmE [Borrelia coriaceae]AHH11902.1 PTS system, diacetylchitobiose-specific IIB component [Borrelia coriaceae ATCC 43381]